MTGSDPDALQRENERLRRSVEELAVLNEVAAALGSARDLETILRRIVRQALGAVAAEQGTVTLIDAARSDENRTIVRTSVRSSEGAAFRPSEVLLGWVRGVHRLPARADARRTAR